MLLKQLKDLSAKGCYKSAKKWWKSLSSTQKALIIGVLAMVIASPLIIMWAKKLMVTNVSAIAVNEAGTEAIFHVVQQSAPMWHKVLFSTIWLGSIGAVSAGYAAAYYEV